MAITIAANLAKKLPIPGTDFSSQQASITITAEVSDLNQVATEAKRLFSLAELAVDAQLSQNPSTTTPTGSQPSQSSTLPTSPAVPPKPQQASQPYHGNTPRRAPVPISAAQLRFLRQLLERTPGAIDRILVEHRISSIEALSSRAASSVIDQLKAATP